MRVYLNSCRANLDLITAYGVPMEQLPVFYPNLGVGGDAMARMNSRLDGALVGVRVAERRALAIGDEVVIGPVIANVVGTFDTGGTMLDNVVFMHIDHLTQSIPAGEIGVVSQHLVRLGPDADATAISRAIDERFARDEAPTQTLSMGDYINRTIGEIAELIGFAQLLGYVAVLVMALVLANTVFMSAQARRAELAVLQVVGVTRGGLVMAVVGEGMLLALLGGAIGLGLVSLALMLRPIGIGVEGIQIDFLPTTSLMVEGMVLALATGGLAALGPGCQAAYTSVADAMRSS